MSASFHRSQPETDYDHPFQLLRIELEHFKSVDSAKVDLAPLSVLVGTNSSGKSTLLQPVLAMCQAAKVSGSAGEALLNGDLQNLGEYREVLNFRVDQFEKRYLKSGVDITRDEYRRIDELSEEAFGSPIADKISIGFRVVKALETIDWSISVEESGTKSDLSAKVSSINVLLTDEQAYTCLFYNGNGRLWLSQLLDTKPEAKDALPLAPLEFDEIFANMYGDAGWSETWEGPNLENQSQQDHPRSLVREMEGSTVVFRVRESFSFENPELISDRGISQYYVQVQDTYSGGDLWDRSCLIKETDFILDPSSEEANWSKPLITRVNSIIEELFGEKVSYLGPLRAPPREMAQADRTSVGTKLGNRGEHTAAVLELMKDKKMMVPLPGGYEDVARLGGALNRWLQWFGLADDATVRRARRSVDLSVNPTGAPTSVDLSSVGVGVSQVLPIILLCLLSKPADVLILEQPELHLHPALQKRLADFLLVFVRAGRQILVETHSDHLVNQLRYQVAADDTDETRKLVRLIFAEQTDGITTYRESEINEYGGLSEDWPDGFLDISAKSAQDLVRHSLRKMKLRRPRPTDAN